MADFTVADLLRVRLDVSVEKRQRDDCGEAAAMCASATVEPIGGEFAGRAPKGYRRKDEQIREDVCELLAGHGDLDASEIEVEVTDGDVFLRGSVRSRWAKLYAEDLAASARGVRDVMNHLRILRDVRGEEQGGPTTGA